MTKNNILILDFGSQYSQLITRSVRELSVYCEQLPWHVSSERVQNLDPAGIILSGGPASIYDTGSPQLPGWVLELGIPILGICYGMQALTQALKGQVQPAAEREYGPAVLQVIETNPLLPAGSYQAWMSHGDRISQLPAGFKILASTKNSPAAAMGDLKRKYFGVQFHPEVKHTVHGSEILANFLFNICQVKPSWTPESIIDNQVSKIQGQIGKQQVLAAVSGGVDSSVAAALVHQAVGNQLQAVFVDTGLLRKEEGIQVIEAFRDTLGYQLHVIQAADQFFSALQGISDPEEKRTRIGNLFIRLFEKKAREIGTPPFLVQGTIYPDVVESYAPDRAETKTIKTHHNVGGLPERMDFKLVEPLRYLFKDEVRKIGEKLNLPDFLIWRQPFPGPGLAIRILGEVTPERVQVLQSADSIFRDELKQAGLLRMQEETEEIKTEQVLKGTAQSFAVLLPVKSVGVMGDNRTYQNVIALRSVTTNDFMTADWSRLPEELLARVSNRIVNEVSGINRVVYDITSKPPGTIEWE